MSIEVPFKYKDVDYTLVLGISEQQYSMANCGIVGLSHITPSVISITTKDSVANIKLTYIGEQVQAAFLASDEAMEYVGKALIDKWKPNKYQFFINDAVNYNRNYWHTRIMEWLRDNAEKYGGTIWAGPLSPNPNYTNAGADNYHMTQCLIWIPNGVPTCTSRKSVKTKKWYTNPSKEQVDKKILPKTRIYT